MGDERIVRDRRAGGSAKKYAAYGIVNYILKFDVVTERKNVLGFKEVNEIMDNFIRTMKTKPFKSMETKAAFIQNNFTKFAQFMQSNYTKK